MRNLPSAIKIILNIIFFIIYSAFGQLLSGLMLGFIFSKLGKNIPVEGDPVFIKIGIVISLFILFLTLVFRKYFYISLEKKEKLEKINKEEFFINNKDKEENKKKDKEENKKKDKADIKIYIEKELNK